MSERSPTPWTVADAEYWRIYDANRFEVVNDGGVVSEELSARIVHAVNLHGEMVEALREAQLQIEYLHDKFKATGTGETTLHKIRSALAKATP